MFFSHLKHKSINDCSGLSSNFYLILTVFFSRMHGIIGSSSNVPSQTLTSKSKSDPHSQSTL
uniref:Uncharacterized protein n=1 Tax=Helianthus annuus TaxID=4232 RepID=A0A251U2Z9_HELAN